MGATYTFSFADFSAAFPELAAIGSGLATAYFNRATTLHANDGTGPVQDATQQQDLLLLLTAHIAFLNAPRDGNGNPAASGAPAPPIVGRISSASEGSVSVSAEWNSGAGGANPTEAWFVQTRYGAEYWAATAIFRTGHYVRAPLYVSPLALFPWRRGW